MQAKRRAYLAKKRASSAGGAQPHFLTTVIPYQAARGTPDNPALNALIKSPPSFPLSLLAQTGTDASCPVLRAVNEDSPQVPNILTDYILNGTGSPQPLASIGEWRVGIDAVLCPSSTDGPGSLPIC